MLAEYRQAHAETGGLKAYNDQLATQVKSQQDELNTMTRQLAEIETTSREVLPLMQKMLDTLEQFVALDVPFLPEERARRVAAARGDDDARRRDGLREVPPHRRGLPGRDGVRAHASRPTRARSATNAPCSSCASAASRCSTRRSTARRPATGTPTRRSWVAGRQLRARLQGGPRGRQEAGRARTSCGSGAGAEGGEVMISRSKKCSLSPRCWFRRRCLRGMPPRQARATSTSCSSRRAMRARAKRRRTRRARTKFLAERDQAGALLAEAQRKRDAAERAQRAPRSPPRSTPTR